MSGEPAMKADTLIAAIEAEVAPLKSKIVRLRTALQNCRMFFDANNRPNYVAMIDEAMGEQLSNR